MLPSGDSGFSGLPAVLRFNFHRRQVEKQIALKRIAPNQSNGVDPTPTHGFAIGFQFEVAVDERPHVVPRHFFMQVW